MKPLTNCINCGGILVNGICPFCGADYNTAKHLSIELDDKQVYATIYQDGKEYKAYLTHMELNPIHVGIIDGTLNVGKMGIIRKWTFIQKDVSWIGEGNI